MYHTEEVEKKGIIQDDLLDLFQWPHSNIFRNLTWIALGLRSQNSKTLVAEDTLLHFCARHGICSTVDAIIDKFASGSSDGKAEVTPIGQGTVMLINRHEHETHAVIDFEVHNRDGETPLSCALSGHHSELANKLISAATTNLDVDDADSPHIEPEVETAFFRAWKKQGDLPGEGVRAVFARSPDPVASSARLHRTFPDADVFGEEFEGDAQNVRFGFPELEILFQRKPVDFDIPNGPLIDILDRCLDLTDYSRMTLGDRKKWSALVSCKTLLNLLVEKMSFEKSILIASRVFAGCSINEALTECVLELLESKGHSGESAIFDMALQQAEVLEFWRILTRTIIKDVPGIFRDGALAGFQRLSKSKPSIPTLLGNPEGGITAGARLKHFAVKAMALLLEGYSDPEIPEGLLVSAAGNSKVGSQLLTLLFDAYDSKIEITEEVLVATVENASHHMAAEVISCVQERALVTHITERVLVTTVKIRNFRKAEKLISLFLGDPRSKVDITEYFIKHILWNNVIAQPVMSVLLRKKGCDMSITEKLVLEAVKNEGHAKDSMTQFLYQETWRTGIDQPFPADVMDGKEIVMKTLLREKGSDICITERVLIEAV